MTRHDLFEQTHLASIDNNHMATFIALFCRCVISFRLKSIDKKTLYSLKTLNRSITSRKRIDYSQADTQLFDVCFRQEVRQTLEMLLKALIKGLSLSYIENSLRFPPVHCIENINTFLPSFRLGLNCITRKEAFPFNLKTVHCNKEYRSQWRYCQC